MKFTLSWLKQYLDTDASLSEICDTLTLIGLEVEEIIDNAAKLAPFTVGYVTDAVQHPNADKLRLCTVDLGNGVSQQVVCGAPNARKGIKIVFAREGLTVPSNGMLLKPVEIRGVKSSGMICSEREMGISDEHDGIIELPDDAEIGAPFAPILGIDDPVIDIAITPNRPDALGVYGIARDLAAAGLGTLRTDQAKVTTVKGSFKSEIGIKLDFNDDHKACKQFAGRLIKNIENRPSPKWLQQRLIAVGLRPISALVDITNYVSIDRCRPLHVYDADKISGDIVARMGRGDESFTALDGKDYTANETICVIADDAHILGFGGVMGGEQSGSQTHTTNVFIESAYFDHISVAICGRQTGIQSDARYRNERGIDTQSCVMGIDYATQLVLDFCGTDATEISEIVVAGKAPTRDKKISFPISEVKRISSLDIAKDRMISILTDLGFIVSGDGDVLAVTAPEWRPDIHGKQDLVEEIVRIYGFDEVASTALERLDVIAKPVLNALQDKTARSRRVLASRGMKEAVTYSFIPQAHAEMFGGGAAELILDNPISVEMSTMRPSLLPNLLAASARNAGRGISDQAIFEVGQVFLGSENADQKLSATGIRRGTAKLAGQGRHWAGKTAKVDLYDVKADVIAMLNGIGERAERFQTVAEAPSHYHPGRSGTLRLGPKNIIAHFGEIHPRILKAFGINEVVVAFEITLNALPVAKKKTIGKGALNLSNLLEVKRDLAFIVDENTQAEKLMNAVIGADKKQISNVILFDVYQGTNLGEGLKSLAVEFSIKQTDKTLTDEEITAIMNKVAAKVEKTTGGKLRDS
ncbi:MAG: phenylalanine--tRNA ligase subunit beta [Rhizobiales bacterium]|nr:phenylalanine--tRNA ligase subunit beta [Hyphomicrobiales bacterium]NRB14259.1 phenylalanine--tRNA ligase subunit beta [Hyphomicrobiales bacterium]